MEHDGCCSRLYTGLSTVVGDIILGTAARGEGRSGMLRIAHRSRARHGGNPLTSPRLRRAAWDCRRLENPSSSHHCESAFARPAASPRIAAARMPLLSRHQKAAPTLHTARRVPTICMAPSGYARWASRSSLVNSITGPTSATSNSSQRACAAEVRKPAAARARFAFSGVRASRF